MWTRWCLLFSKRQHGKFPGKVHIPGTALESTFHCNPSRPLGLKFFPRKHPLSQAASPGGSQGLDKEPSVEGGHQGNGGHPWNLTFPVSKARRAPEAVTSGANSERLETALTIWHWVSPEGLQWSGGGECKIFLLPGLSNAQKQCCQVPAKNEYVPEEFNKVQNKTNPQPTWKQRHGLKSLTVLSSSKLTFSLWKFQVRRKVASHWGSERGSGGFKAWFDP